MPTRSFALFLIVTLSVLLVPGPSVVFVVTSTLQQGRAAGLRAVAGLEGALLVHVVAASLGLSALVASSPFALTALKAGGAAYLAFLGLSRLREVGVVGHLTQAVVPQLCGPRIFRTGFLIDLLNPKTILFFVALFPQFVDPARGGVRTQVLVLGGVVVVLATLCDSTYAVAADLLQRRRRSAEPSKVAAYVPGAALLCLAVVAALS